MRDVWRYRAVLCRYAHQSIYEMLGRDPIRDPLTSIESSLLAWAIIEHVTAERRPMAEIGLPPSED